MITLLIILLAVAALILLYIVAIRKRWITNARGSFTGISVYHDWINKDAQRGVDIIVKRNAGDKESEDESGEPPFKTE